MPPAGTCLLNTKGVCTVRVHTLKIGAVEHKMDVTVLMSRLHILEGSAKKITYSLTETANLQLASLLLPEIKLKCRLSFPILKSNT